MNRRDSSRRRDRAARVDGSSPRSRLRAGAVLQSLVLFAMLASEPLPAKSDASTGDAANIWEPIGPFAAVVESVAVASSGGVLYAGAEYGGFFTRTVGAAHWRGRNEGLPDCTSVLSIVVDPTDPATVFIRTDTDYSLGLYKSTDSGARWRRLGADLKLVSRTGPMVIDPSNHQRIYLNTGKSIFRSQDGGETWEPLGAPFRDYWMSDLITDPGTTSTLYAAFDYDGLYKSVDGGERWDRLTEAFPAQGLAADPTTPGVLYACGYDGLFRSADGGDTWAQLGGARVQAIRPEIVRIDRIDPGTIYVAGFRGVLRTRDGGSTWADLTPSRVDREPLRALVLDPSSSGTLYLGGGDYYESRGYVLKSTDYGATWDMYMRGISVTEVSTLSAVPGATGMLYAGSPFGLFTTADAGGDGWDRLLRPARSWALWESSCIAVGGSGPGAIYFGADEEGLRRSPDGGSTWQRIGNKSYPLWTTPESITIDPATSSTLYVAGVFRYSTARGVFRSEDRGDTWSQIDAPFGTRSIVADPNRAGVLYSAGHGFTKVSRSDDGGTTWESASIGLPNKEVTMLVVNPLSTNILYAATAGKGVFKSADSGGHWAPANGRMTASDVSDLVLDLSAPDTLYAAAQGRGVLMSLDGGASWTPINGGLPSRRVNALALDSVDSSILYAGTPNGVYRARLPGAVLQRDD